MNKKKYILIILSLIMVAVFTSACKQSKQAKGDETSENSSISASKTETSQEDSIDFSQLTGDESNGGTSQKKNSEKADNKTVSGNKSTVNNKDTTDNKGAADNKDKTDSKDAVGNKETAEDSSSTDNKNQNSEDKPSQPSGGMDVASDTATGFGPLL